MAAAAQNHNRMFYHVFSAWEKNQNVKYWARHAYVFGAIIKVRDPKSSDYRSITVNNPDDLVPL